MKVTVILNSRSANRVIPHVKATLEQNLGNTLMGIEESGCPHHAAAVARQAIEQGADTIVTAGGDGTINSVLNVLVGAEVALGILPMGTANDLAALYQIPTDLGNACQVILKGQVSPADLISVNGHHYITTGGLGLSCKIAQFANAAKQRGQLGRGIFRRLGSKLYFFAALYALFRERPQHDRLHVRWNGGFLSTHSLSLMVSNQSFAGKYFFMSPEASNDDGLFDVCLIENSGRRTGTFLTFLKVLAGRHVNSQGVKLWRAAELIVDAGRPLPFFGDGELISRASHLRIKILPGAVNVIVPEHIAPHFQNPKYPTLDKGNSVLCSPN